VAGLRAHHLRNVHCVRPSKQIHRPSLRRIHARFRGAHRSPKRQSVLRTIRFSLRYPMKARP